MTISDGDGYKKAWGEYIIALIVTSGLFLRIPIAPWHSIGTFLKAEQTVWAAMLIWKKDIIVLGETGSSSFF